jgi:[protein-PII] uridylyltransferase
MPSNEASADPVRALASERERLHRRHLEGLSGLEFVRSLTAAVDAAVTALWAEIVGDRTGIALVALGGYGRGELSPYSDLDLMVLHDGGRGGPESAKALFYRLWDAGLEVGHAVRTPGECIKLARVNFEAETSFLETRRLAGDRALFDEFSSAVLRFTRKRGRKFLRDARTAVETRHSIDGNASCLLEPNLKEGAGGLRDLHTIRWLNIVFGRGAAGENEPVAEILHRTRNHLHHIANRRQDVLLLDYQESAAAALGWKDEPGWSAWDGFMRDIYRSTRSVEAAMKAAFEELDATVGRKRQRSNVSVAPARRTIARLSEAAPESAEAWTDEMRRAFFDLLETGDAEALKDFDQTGAMSRYIPEWDLIRYRPQHNVYHRFTVDIHAYQTAARLARLHDEKDEPIAAQVALDVRDGDLLRLAGLLHDLGKGSPGDHSEAGKRLGRQIAARIGLDRARADTLAWLIRNHLLLIDTATRRDTGDENLVVETAAQVGDPQRLRMLYALSVADGLGTGPTAWTSWKSTLVAELFNRMLHVLERGDVVSPDATELVKLRIAELRRGLERHPLERVDAHVKGMSRAYFLAYPALDLIRHFALMDEPLPSGEVRTHVSRVDDRGLYELTLVAADRPGLFSVAAGALALNGMNVVSAQIQTRADGAALEVFRVTGALDPVISDERWGRFVDDVRAALRGALPLGSLLDEKRRDYERRSQSARRKVPGVVVDNTVSDFYTVVEVHTADRIGVLYAITGVLADLGFDIHLAKIATYGEEVVDVFYVWDSDGQKVVDDALIGDAKRRIVGAIVAS